MRSVKCLMKLFRYLSDIKHMIELLLQKERIEPGLEFYDDGDLYYIYNEKPHDYSIKDSKGYTVVFCGTYGECMRQKKHYQNKNFKLISSREYEKFPSNYDKSK